MKYNKEFIYNYFYTIFHKFIVFLKLDNKKNKFIVFGLSSNITMSFYRILLIYNETPSLIIVDKNNLLFIKFLEIFLLLFFSIIILSLYLKSKTENSLEKGIIYYNFFPNLFTKFIRIERFLSINPLFTLFLIPLLALLLFFKMIFFGEKTIFIAILFTIFRTFFLAPFLFFRNIYNINDMKGHTFLTKNFLYYCVIYKELQNSEFQIVRPILLFISFIAFMIAYKSAQLQLLYL